MAEKRSVEARDDGLVSSQRVQMTTYVSCWQVRKTKQQQEKPQNHFGPQQEYRKQQSSMRKPGIPPARIPDEITKSSLHGMTFTLTL